MSYAQIHTQALRHRKVLSLSADAFRLWVAGHCYCQEHLSDGEIPKVALVALGVPVRPKFVTELLAQALWHEAGDGYQVHDWADWNDTREQVATRRVQRRVRHQRWLQKQSLDASRDASLDASGDALGRPHRVPDLAWPLPPDRRGHLGPAARRATPQ